MSKVRSLAYTEIIAAFKRDGWRFVRRFSLIHRKTAIAYFISSICVWKIIGVYDLLWGERTF
jgi:hypothetical protein